MHSCVQYNETKYDVDSYTLIYPSDVNFRFEFS